MRTELHLRAERLANAEAAPVDHDAAAFASRHGIPVSYADYEQLVADPSVDVVYISAPHTEHARLALLAIAAGLGEQAERTGNRALLVGFQRRGVFELLDQVLVGIGRLRVRIAPIPVRAIGPWSRA